MSDKIKFSSFHRTEAYKEEYDIIDKIGQGGFGGVYIVENKKRGTHHAMKVLDKVNKEGKDMCDGALREKQVSFLRRRGWWLSSRS